MAHAAAILGREIAADVVADHLVVVRTGEEPDTTRLIGAGIGDNAVVGDDDALVVAAGVGGRQVRRADADGAVGTAVVLYHVVGDLQVAGIGVGEDRAALCDQAAGQAGHTAADDVDIAGEALLVAAAQVEAVDRWRRGSAVHRRKGLALACDGAAGRRRHVDRDDRAVVDGGVAAPVRCRVAGGGIHRRLQGDAGVPVSRHRTVAGEGAAVDDGAAHRTVGAARADALQLDAAGDDQVFVVRAARVLAWVGARVVRIDDDQRLAVVGVVDERGRGVECFLDRMVGCGWQRFLRREVAGGRNRTVDDSRAHFEELRVVAGSQHMKRQAVDRALTVGRDDLQLLRPHGICSGLRDHHGDLVRTPRNPRGQRSPIEENLACGRAEARATDGERARRGAVAGTDVRAGHRIQLRRRIVEPAHHRRRGLRARQLDGHAHLRRCQVGRDDLAGQNLELGRDGAVARVVVEIQAARHARVVADVAVQVGADTGRRRAVDAVGRRQQHIGQAVVVGFDGLDEPVGPVVDAHRHERHAGLLAIGDRLRVAREVEVIDGDEPVTAGQRHVGEDVERGRDRLAVVEPDELDVAQRLVLALVGRGAGTAGEGGIAGRIDDVQRTGAGRRQCGGRDELVAVADVDVFFASHLVDRVAEGVRQ